MWDIGICLIFNSPADDEGEQGENKTNISLVALKLV